MLGQPRPGGKNEAWKIKERFAGTSLCSPKSLELDIIWSLLWNKTDKGLEKM